MDDLAKFQPHQTADDKIMITLGLLFWRWFMSFFVPLIMHFIVSFKLHF